MSKVKIVQIALAASESEIVSEYLDDKGRVWQPHGHWENPSSENRKWIQEWDQLDLPEEPNNEQL